jgi:cytochrome c-type biogenesis protein CcmF
VWPAGVALLAGVVLVLLGAGSSPPGLVGYTFGAFVLAAIALEFARGTRARRSLGDSTWWSALTGLVARNRRRYGGYVVHAAIVLLLVGAVGIGGFGTTREAKLSPGESLEIGSYDLNYLQSAQRRAANAVEMRARFDVSRNGKPVGTVSAGKNRYLAEQQVSNEVAIRSDWLRAEDLFVIVDQFNGDGTIFVKVLVNPLVNLIWLGGIVFVFGSLIAMWPDAREQRRLARHASALSYSHT